MAQSKIYGLIDAKGNIRSGSGGYTVSHDKTGMYTLKFNKKFSNRPAISGMVDDGNNSNVNTKARVLTFNAVEQDHATVVLRRCSDHERQNVTWNFIAVGAT